MEVRERRRARLVSVLVTVAVLWPALPMLFGRQGRDSFPLSAYPMFSGDPGRVVEVATVIGLGAGGDVIRLSPETIAGTDQVIQAAMAVRRAIAGGDDRTHALCIEVAGRLRDRSVDAVAVVLERYDSVEWAAGEKRPRQRQTVATCEP